MALPSLRSCGPGLLTGEGAALSLPAMPIAASIDAMDAVYAAALAKEGRRPRRRRRRLLAAQA